jgi:hypothetical protein
LLVPHALYDPGVAVPFSGTGSHRQCNVSKRVPSAIDEHEPADKSFAETDDSRITSIAIIAPRMPVWAPSNAASEQAGTVPSGGGSG